MTPDPLCHVVTAHIEARADDAFAYLANPEKVGEWALGAFGATRLGNTNNFSGKSLVDDSDVVFAVDADPKRLIVDYLVGSDAAHLAMRISARIVAGENFERAPGTCLVSLMAWRPAAFDDRRWHRLRAFHDAEIHILRHKIEQGARRGEPIASAGIGARSRSTP